MKSLHVRAYRTEQVVHVAEVIVEMPSESMDIDAERLQELIDLHCVDWDVSDSWDEGTPDFDVEAEIVDTETRSLPVISYSPTDH